jgi:hypothetical protein
MGLPFWRIEKVFLYLLLPLTGTIRRIEAAFILQQIAERGLKHELCVRMLSLIFFRLMKKKPDD